MVHHTRYFIATNLVFLLLSCPYRATSAERRDKNEDANPISSFLSDVITQTSDALTLDERDYRTIRRQGNVFLVPASVRRKALLNIPEFSNQGTVRRVRSGDEIVGFRIESLSKTGIFPHLGLAAGDIIRSVNGYPVKSESDALSLLSRLSNSDQIQLDIERGPKRDAKRFYYRLLG